MAACMALERALHITRVTFGSGKIDENVNLADVHELLQYVLEGTITERRHHEDHFCKKTIYNEIARGICIRQTTDYEFVKRYCADVAERKYQENLRAKGPDIKLGKDFAFVKYIEDPIINKKRSPGADPDRWEKV